VTGQGSEDNSNGLGTNVFKTIQSNGAGEVIEHRIPRTDTPTKVFTRKMTSAESVWIVRGKVEKPGRKAFY